MGCAISSPEATQSRRIDRLLAKDGAKENRIIKLLLLGPGDSGKSTIMKQVKILHNNGFTDDELRTWRPIIYQNIFGAMKDIINAMDKFGMKLETESNTKNVDLIQSLCENEDLNEFMPTELQRSALESLWQDSSVQQCFARSHEYQVPESSEYFFHHLDRIFSEDYLPTTEDALKLRVITTGVIESAFQAKYKKMTLNFKIIDVGGQRSERRKWIHCFEDVNAVLFVVAISEYNQVLMEDGVTNRMLESLKLFESIVNNKFFAATSFILFLNKEDLFDDKIKKFRLSDYYPKFKGGPGEAKQFIAEEYLSKVQVTKQGKKKKVYHHFTCATDTKQVRHIFEDVVNIIIERSLEELDLK